jgi:hypothetical protein
MYDETETTSFEPQCSAVAGRLAAGILGAALPSHEQAQLLRHLMECARCRSRLNDYVAIAALLPLQAPMVEPPAGLRERIMEVARRKRQHPPG